MSVTLQANDGIAISSDSAGVVRTWDILTDLCKASFHTPVKGVAARDVQLIGDRLILVWSMDAKVHVYDIKQGESLQTVEVSILGDPQYHSLLKQTT